MNKYSERMGFPPLKTKVSSVNLKSSTDSSQKRSKLKDKNSYKQIKDGTLYVNNRPVNKVVVEIPAFNIKKEFISIKEAAEFFNVSHSTIVKHATGENTTNKLFRLYYIQEKLMKQKI